MLIAGIPTRGRDCALVHNLKLNFPIFIFTPYLITGAILFMTNKMPKIKGKSLKTVNAAMLFVVHKSAKAYK
jgi:hypothetical protein